MVTYSKRREPFAYTSYYINFTLFSPTCEGRRVFTMVLTCTYPICIISILQKKIESNDKAMRHLLLTTTVSVLEIFLGRKSKVRPRHQGGEK